MIPKLCFTDYMVCLKAHLWDQYFLLFNICHNICQLFVNIVKSHGETYFPHLFVYLRNKVIFKSLFTKLLQNLQEHFWLWTCFKKIKVRLNTVPHNSIKTHGMLQYTFLLVGKRQQISYWCMNKHWESVIYENNNIDNTKKNFPEHGAVNYGKIFVQIKNTGWIKCQSSNVKEIFTTRVNGNSGWGNRHSVFCLQKHTNPIERHI